MRRIVHRVLTCAVITATAPASFAQSLAQPSPVSRVMDVVQFGAPRDAKYIVCEETDCPDRTIKTLTASKAVAVRPPEPSFQQQSLASLPKFGPSKPFPVPGKPNAAERKPVDMPQLRGNTPTRDGGFKR